MDITFPLQSSFPKLLRNAQSKVTSLSRLAVGIALVSFFMRYVMPQRTPKACRKRGCRNATTDPSGYCNEHKGEGWRNYKPGQSRQRRGYGRSWDITRLRIMKRDKGLCQECLRRGAIREASCVDHIRPVAHGGGDSDDNLQSLCTPCHRTKTARERLTGR